MYTNAPTQRRIMYVHILVDLSRSRTTRNTFWDLSKTCSGVPMSDILTPTDQRAKSLFACQDRFSKSRSGSRSFKHVALSTCFWCRRRVCDLSQNFSKFGWKPRISARSVADKTKWNFCIMMQWSSVSKAKTLRVKSARQESVSEILWYRYKVWLTAW